jgi:hypothetical protein
MEYDAGIYPILPICIFIFKKAIGFDDEKCASF